MGRTTIVILRVVIALALAGSLVVQTVIVPLMWIDLVGAPTWFRVGFVTIVVLGVLTMQVFALCVWMLLTKVRRGSIFQRSSFRYVDVIIGAFGAAAVLALAMALVLKPTEIAPGLVALVGGAALVLGGMALLMVVMKALLRQAIDREHEAQTLRTELGEVI
ncbi:DUF2975 domain-containing protein [Microbacterium sp. Bi121]|uniref:DUF2975 domain-containing protein n=1 Tax=Microbacterium sp. Bi121 TaxID=2822348 RepID=UPI001D215920|nr:DUF2975 domain-containing protein [Microbacterium sp. Bi121]CAH0123289.1 hypothetical protein SRABI121_00468 [Microbacterium sp. Bi121]